MPRQHALLLLQGSTSALLRHLPRTLMPRDCQGLYGRLDKVLADTIGYIAKIDQMTETERLLITVPRKLGGLGISLYAESAALSHAASREAALATLDAILGLNQDYESLGTNSRLPQLLGPTTSLSAQTQQESRLSDRSSGSEMMQEAYIDIRKKLITDRLEKVRLSVDSYRQQALVENTAYLSFRWLTSLPTSAALRLSDSDVASMLSIRLLHTPQEQDDLCRHCSLVYHYGHEDVCKASYRQTTIKHDQICAALTAAFNNVPKVKAILEPRTEQDTERRTDIRVDSPQGTTYYDITVVSVMAKTASYDPFSTLSVEELNKKRKHAILGADFRPFVVSQGGLLGKETAASYKAIQKQLTYTASSFLDQYLSGLLGRIRARCWNGHSLN